MKPEDEDHNEGPGLLVSRAFWAGAILSSVVWLLVIWGFVGVMVWRHA